MSEPHHRFEDRNQAVTAVRVYQAMRHLTDGQLDLIVDTDGQWWLRRVDQPWRCFLLGRPSEATMMAEFKRLGLPITWTDEVV